MGNAGNKYCAARRLLFEEKYGVLSTHSIEAAGYPFGSVVPYCIDDTGQPIILISNLAEHTKNIVKNPRVSLTVLERGSHNVQEQGRLTCLADALRIPGQDHPARKRYHAYFPKSIEYEEVHGFFLYQLELARLRFIAGFGEIHWLDVEPFVKANPFSIDSEIQITSHMNQDHRKALRDYFRLHKNIAVSSNQTLKMVGIDAEGFDVSLDEELHRFWFPSPIATTEEARKTLAAMAKS